MENRKASKPYIPYLPQIPDKIYGEPNSVQKLTNRAESEWQFLFREIKDIPSPYAEAQDYDFNKISPQEWQNVVVPSSLIMQGFDIENNTEYYYKRTVKLPRVKRLEKLILRFEGVYSNARVWVNNRYINTHIGGFTQWDCDLSAFSQEEEITLIIGVTDAEGNKKGIWNPGGETISNAAWASYYAHCNIGGIIRDIKLFTLPKNHIARTHINTRLNGGSGVVETYIEAFSDSKDISAQIVLLDGDSIVAQSDCALEKLLTESRDNAYDALPDAKWIKTHKKAYQNDEKYKYLYVPYSCDHFTNYAGALAVCVNAPKLWDAEHPNLYTLKIRLMENGVQTQENTYRIGIREITYGGKNGAPKNKVYINGSEIKLRGVCRHDVSHLYGRSLTEEDIYNEILTYKKHNINFIRTSHYPAPEYMLQVCDALGMYVEQENAACFKGANNFEIYNGPQEFLQSFAEMIEGARNHTSVIIWSLANESDFEKTYAFRAEFDYAKKIDLSRPLIFSYPHLVHSKPLPYDILSKHYAKVTGNLGDKKFPLLHDEFAHVPCYNVESLKRDNSVRDFWGESIRKGWNRIFNTDGALGCAVWAAADDVFCIPKGTSERHQHHSQGGYAGYGEWGCIFDQFKREKPEAYLTKKAFTPVLIDESKTQFGSDVRLYVTNRFDHTDLSEIRMKVTDGEKTVYDGMVQSSVKPHKSGVLTFKNTGADEYSAEFYHNEILVDKYVLKARKTAERKITGASGLEDCIDPVDSVFIYKKAKYRIVQAVDRDKVTFKIIPLNLHALLAKPGECVLKLKLKQDVVSVSWKKRAQYSYYPNGHIGRAEGTAYPCGADNSYGEKPETPWEADNENYFLYPESNGKRGLSNDFLTKRNHIFRYTVSLSNGKNISFLSEDGSINAVVCPVGGGKSGFEVQISAGSYYPDLQWGNDFGKRFEKLRNRCVSFAVSCTQGVEK